ncbi:MAG: hypothetical protein F4Z00_14240 [Acidimicrobiaceae bacterium]|nr:DUF6159 family protein [Acidimicrobiaceae bacterium]MDE0665122.1 DUF6159 family protein [Acidimicrobiaceae bacterium]MXY09388.1 hypothetical protein [Acidimicrobiaceae bacterium]MXZ66683.1 hypothetical protein [Acidimicrobiaceae bacterium]MYA14693.1 hypothetical protein [Acidimicrobiaceae bacterium]
MGRLSNTWSLAKVSWSVLKKDRELLWMPVLSFLASAVVIVVVIGLTFVTLSTESTHDQTTMEFNPAMIVVYVLAAMVLGVIAVFFNGALVAGAHERLTGGDPTVRSAIGRAFARIGGLVPWAIITTTVGLVLQALRDRAGWLGRIVTHMLEMAWEVVTFLTVPAIVIDNVGAIEGLKRSASLLRNTWGENIAARVGFGLLGFVLIIPAAVVAGLFIASGWTVLMAIGIIAAAAWVAVVMVVLTALNAVFQTALYLYATTGMPPTGFEQAPLEQTFVHK